MTETFTAVEHAIHYTGFDTEERKKEQFEDIILDVLSTSVRDVVRQMDKALHDYLFQRFGGVIAVIKKYTDTVRSADVLKLSEYKMACVLLRNTIQNYIYNLGEGVENLSYEKYKEWREINGQYDSESEEEEPATTD